MVVDKPRVAGVQQLHGAADDDGSPHVASKHHTVVAVGSRKAGSAAVGSHQAGNNAYSGKLLDSLLAVVQLQLIV